MVEADPSDTCLHLRFEGMRPTKLHWAGMLAQVVSTRGTCVRRQVGCVLLNERGQILSTGYNGRARGLAHCLAGVPCASAQAAPGTNLEGCEALHAEQNALLSCQDPYQIDAAVVTASPCVTCVKLLLNTSCKLIVFYDLYPDPTALPLWERAGREWLQLGHGGLWKEYVSGKGAAPSSSSTLLQEK